MTYTPLQYLPNYFPVINYCFIQEALPIHLSVTKSV